MSEVVPPEEISEVVAYQDAEETREAFRTAHKKVFEQYDELVEDRNQKLGAADKKVRALQVTCGDWRIKNTRIQWDYEGLCEFRGRERFLEIPGTTIHTITEKGGDKARLEAAYAAGTVSKEEADMFRKETLAYSTPKKVTA
jgi:hypothetical protein